ncbi:DUF4118 domain-containing protein, partial [Pseudomonas viridiflava]|uniref:DUF4118 domain-containing protein n=1 Tax=Pseudomonas viridiflava TaxID=33069 RepID=UPI003C79DFED
HRRIFGGGVAARLLREGHGLEVCVHDDSEQQPDQPPRARPLRDVVWFDYGLALIATVLASLVAWGVSGLLALPNISLIFLAAVLLVAVRSSMGP